MPSEFSCLNLWHENEHGFAKDNFVIFSCLSASIAGGLTAQKSTQRMCAPSGLPWGWDTICTFFACTKKVPKKYPEGLRALSTPGDAVKLRLRFSPQVLRRYWKFHSMLKRKKALFFFTPLQLRAKTGGVL